MKILSYNVNGIRAAFKKGFTTWLEATQADVICIQETKAMEDQVETAILAQMGYHHYWFSAQQKDNSGVAILSRKKPVHSKTTSAPIFDQDNFAGSFSANTFMF